ncbi:MAG: FumA C-terminus/TtdB family hydratase beta subunit [Candidatus Njordarchaeia archaeon]
MAEYHFKTPLKEEDVRKLNIGDIVYISGTMVTARDSAHERALELAKEGKLDEIPVKLEGLALYHCGPVVKKIDDKWKVIAGGPTTSARMESLEGDFIRTFKVRAIIGKGGMGKNTAQAAKEVGAFYGAFTGGAAALAAQSIKEVKGVHWLDLGTPEALWVLEVEEFGPLVVAIDAKGNNLYEDVYKEVEENRKKAYARLRI